MKKKKQKKPFTVRENVWCLEAEIRDLQTYYTEKKASLMFHLDSVDDTHPILIEITGSIDEAKKALENERQWIREQAIMQMAEDMEDGYEGFDIEEMRQYFDRACEPEVKKVSRICVMSAYPLNNPTKSKRRSINRRNGAIKGGIV